jgi:hypothetical protein
MLFCFQGGGELTLVFLVKPWPLWPYLLLPRHCEKTAPLASPGKVGPLPRVKAGIASVPPADARMLSLFGKPLARRDLHGRNSACLSPFASL